MDELKVLLIIAYECLLFEEIISYAHKIPTKNKYDN